MGDKNKIKLDSMLDLNQVIEYLDNVLQGLKSGTVNVRLGQESVILHPPSVVDFEMKVSQKKDKDKIAVEIGWRKDDSVLKADDVSICDTTPKIEVS